MVHHQRLAVLINNFRRICLQERNKFLTFVPVESSRIRSGRCAKTLPVYCLVINLVKQFSFFYMGKVVIIIAITVLIYGNSRQHGIVLAPNSQTTYIMLIFRHIRILGHIPILFAVNIHRLLYDLRDSSNTLNVFHILIVMLKNLIQTAILASTL